MMPNGAEWFIVLAVVLLLFGGSQLPKLAKNIGKAQKEFKDGLAEGQKPAGESAPGSAEAAAKAEELRRLEARMSELKGESPPKPD